MEKGAIDGAIRDAEQHAEDDRKRKEFAELRNLSDQTLYETEKQLQELGDKVSEGTRKAIEARMEALREALKSDDFATIKKAFETLKQETLKVGVEVYQRSQTQAPPESGPAPPAGGDDVVDVDYDDVKKD